MPRGCFLGGQEEESEQNSDLKSAVVPNLKADRVRKMFVDDFLELELHSSREMATQVEAVSLVAVSKGDGFECPSERETYTSSALQTGARVLDIS